MSPGKQSPEIRDSHDEGAAPSSRSARQRPPVETDGRGAIASFIFDRSSLLFFSNPSSPSLGAQFKLRAGTLDGNLGLEGSFHDQMDRLVTLGTELESEDALERSTPVIRAWQRYNLGELVGGFGVYVHLEVMPRPVPGRPYRHVYSVLVFELHHREIWSPSADRAVHIFYGRQLNQPAGTADLIACSVEGEATIIIDLEVVGEFTRRLAEVIESSDLLPNATLRRTVGKVKRLVQEGEVDLQRACTGLALFHEKIHKIMEWTGTPYTGGDNFGVLPEIWNSLSPVRKEILKSDVAAYLSALAWRQGPAWETLALNLIHLGSVLNAADPGDTHFWAVRYVLNSLRGPRSESWVGQADPDDPGGTAIRVARPEVWQLLAELSRKDTDRKARRLLDNVFPGLTTSVHLMIPGTRADRTRPAS